MEKMQLYLVRFDDAGYDGESDVAGALIASQPLDEREWTFVVTDIENEWLDGEDEDGNPISFSTPLEDYLAEHYPDMRYVGFAGTLFI